MLNKKSVLLRLTTHWRKLELNILRGNKKFRLKKLFKQLLMDATALWELEQLSKYSWWIENFNCKSTAGFCLFRWSREWSDCAVESMHHFTFLSLWLRIQFFGMHIQWPFRLINMLAIELWITSRSLIAISIFLFFSVWCHFTALSVVKRFPFKQFFVEQEPLKKIIQLNTRVHTVEEFPYEFPH